MPCFVVYVACQSFFYALCRCDNRIAAVIQDAGLRVLNTPLDVVTTHVHAAMERDYTEVCLPSVQTANIVYLFSLYID